MRHTEPSYARGPMDGAQKLMCRQPSAASVLTAIGTVIERAAKDTLFWEGDPAEHVYQVLRGTAYLYKLLPDGRRQVARFCHAGDLMGLTVGDDYPYTAGALTRLNVVRIRRSDLEARVDRERVLQQVVVNAMGAELSLAHDLLLLLGRKSAIERVASFLCAMREQAIRDGGDGEAVYLPMTRIDIADFLGLTHETVCRILATLKAQGVIATPDPHWIELRELETLEEIAEEQLCA